MHRKKLELLERERSKFPQITPAISDFGEVEKKHGDALEAVTRTIAIIKEAEKVIPHRYRHADATEEKIIEWVDVLAEGAVPNPVSHVPFLRTGPSLLLVGPPGVGKTYQAYGALRRLSITGVGGSPVAVSTDDLVARTRPRPGVDSEKVFELYATPPFALVDDLGVEKVDDWGEEVIYRLVNHRYENNLTTIFISSAKRKVLESRLGNRVVSRLEEMSQKVEVKGRDRRLSKAS